jgi:hypothetical protein
LHLLAKAFVRPTAPEPALSAQESFVRAPSGLTLIYSGPQREIPPSKMPSPAATLFTYGFDAGPRPTSFVVSILVHCLAAAIILFGFAYKPPIAKLDKEHYTARLLDLSMPDQQWQDRKADAAYPRSQAATSKPASGSKPSPSRPPVLRQMVQAKPGLQTLIQPDLPANVTLNEEIPVPQIVIWTPSKTPVKNIVPPLPQKPTAANVKPTIDVPNQEVNLADINIASSDLPSPRNMVLASTTSPVAVQQPQLVQLPPVSATQNSAQPTPAAILSLSDLRLKNGTAALPPVNESAVSNEQGSLAPGHVRDSSPQGSGDPAAKLGQTGSRPAKSSASGSGLASGPASGRAVASAKPETSAPAQGADLPSESSGQSALTKIALPRDGRFSAVVVGDALDQYPEIADPWSGRIAYTAYLHVGLAKSWLLQYSLPRDADASAGGTVARLDAPWPFNIVRPNLPPGSVNADVIMVHGFIDESGRFQGLSVAFPPAFPRAQFVLDALVQWQFRPAMKDGQPIRVEVLLIVPEEPQ